MACPDATLSALPDLLYESATDQSRWPDFLQELTTTMKETAALLIVHDTDRQYHNVNVVDPLSTILCRQCLPKKMNGGDEATHSSERLGCYRGHVMSRPNERIL
jgi:hypothetical protein